MFGTFAVKMMKVVVKGKRGGGRICPPLSPWIGNLGPPFRFGFHGERGAQICPPRLTVSAPPLSRWIFKAPIASAGDDRKRGCRDLPPPLWDTVPLAPPPFWDTARVPKRGCQIPAPLFGS